MSRQKTLKLFHFAGTAWFILCVGYILVFALRQAGFHWWFIFSLSGHSILIVFLLISLYLFAVFRGVDRSQNIKLEHPLTNTNCYMAFYVVAPLLGGLAGFIGMIGIISIKQFLLGIALGSVVTTFLVWVIVDPVTAVMEMLLSPTSRKHRAKRLTEARAERDMKQKARELLLKDVLANEESNRRHWQQMLQPQAEQLAGLLTTNRMDFGQAEHEAIEIGIKAWQIGGVGCMRHLRDMAIGICRQKNQNNTIVDYISRWWDGIGNWRVPSIQEMININ